MNIDDWAIGDTIEFERFGIRSGADIVGETKTRWKCKAHKWTPDGHVLGQSFSVMKRNGLEVGTRETGQFGWVHTRYWTRVVKKEKA
jgi:hypothetical protein